LLHVSFTDGTLQQSSQLSSISEEPSFELECPMIPSSTITSSEETDIFEEDEKKQSSSTIQKLSNAKYKLVVIILSTISILSIVLWLALFRFFLVQPPEITRTSSSAIIKPGKSM
jgi:hypothetical protein